MAIQNPLGMIAINYRPIRVFRTYSNTLAPDVFFLCLNKVTKEFNQPRIPFSPTTSKDATQELD